MSSPLRGSNGSTRCCTSSTSTTARSSAPAIAAGRGRRPDVLRRREAGWRSCPAPARVAAGYELLYRLGKTLREARRSASTTVDGRRRHACRSIEQTVLAQAVLPAAAVQALQRPARGRRRAASDDPTVLVVAPLSGHHSTLLRDTVATLLARPQGLRHRLDRRARWCRPIAGPFTLDDYVGYVREFIRHIGAERLHVHRGLPAGGAGAGGGRADGGRRRAAAAQPDPDGRPDRRAPQPDPGQRVRHQHSSLQLVRDQPASTRCRAATRAAAAASIPGFLQHAGFMAMNPVRHIGSHWDFYQHLVEGDARRRRGAPPLLRRVQRRARHAGRVLPRLRPHRVPAAPAAARALARRRRARRARGDHRRRAPDHRGRAGRHLRASARRAPRTICAPASRPTASTT